MECLVFARRLRGIRLEGAPDGAVAAETSRTLEVEGPEPAALEAATANLRQLCWQVAGVERCGTELGRALTEVRRRRGQVEADPLLRGALGPAPGERLTIPGSGRQSLLALQDLHQRLVLAELLIEAAGFRAESRGGHYRTDAPAPQPFWRRHSLQRRGELISTRPVGDQGVGTGPL
jgi:L-aspartate oxidase